MSNGRGAEENAGGSKQGTPSGGPSNALYALMIADKIADRFGIGFLILLLIFGAVWKMGSATTQNDFIRELLFQETTGHPYVTGFFVTIVVLNLLGLSGRTSVLHKLLKKETRRVGEETERLKRAADEKSRLQEEILGRPLTHTDAPPSPRERDESGRKRISSISTTGQVPVDDEGTEELDESSKGGRKGVS